MAILKNIDIDKEILENIDIDIDKEILGYIDNDKEILEYIDIDKISNRLNLAYRTALSTGTADAADTLMLMMR